MINLEEIRLSLAESLEQIYDIQRLATRLSNGSVSPKDFVSLKASLQRVPEILEAVSVIDTDLFNDVRSFAPELADFAKRLEKATLDTIEEGVMTGDLARLAAPSAKKVVDSWEFIDEIAKKL